MPLTLSDEDEEQLNGANYEQLLRQQLNAQQPQKEPSFDLGQLGASLAQSANQLGTIGGKTADSSSLKKFADTLTNYKEQQNQNLLAQNQKRQDVLARLAMFKDAQSQKQGLLAQNIANKSSERQADIEKEKLRFENEKKLLGLKNQQEKSLLDTKLAALGEKGTTVGPDGKPVAGKPFKPTEGQASYAYQASRATAANARLKDLEEGGYNPASYGASARGTKFPVVGRYFAKPEDRQYQNVAKAFIASVLRKESGGAVTPEEFAEYGDIYLPSPGDDATTLAQKAALRKGAVDTLVQGAGGAYDPGIQSSYTFAPDEALAKASHRGSSNLLGSDAIGSPPPANAKAKDIGAKPTDQMSDEELDAELARLRGE